MRTMLRSVLFAALVLCLPGRAAEADGQNAATQSARDWNTRGVQLARSGDNQLAIDAFSRAIHLDPYAAGSLINRAIAYIKLEEWEKAEADCTRTIEIDPENARGYQQRAIVRSQMGRHDEAFQDASRAARMEPADPNIVFTRYLACSRLGRHDLGHFAGEIYIGLKSWSDPWSTYQALLNHVSLRRAGQEAEARSILDESMQWVDPNKWPMPIVLYLRGDLESSALLRLADDPDKETIARYYIGVNQWLSGNNEEAKGQFEWILAQGKPDFIQYMLAKDHLDEMTNPDPPAN